MFRTSTLLVCAICLFAQAPSSLKVLLRLPVDLYTVDGIRIEKGQCEIEVKREQGQYQLAFISDGKAKALVNGRPSAQDAVASRATIRLIGTHYLAPPGGQVMKAGERPYSKTGRSQYEEQERDWKHTLRLYKTPDDNEALFVFQERQEQGEWNRIEFSLLLKPK
jgi:hypothetical protein